MAVAAAVAAVAAAVAAAAAAAAAADRESSGRACARGSGVDVCADVAVGLLKVVARNRVI